MSNPPKILAFAGSLRTGSYNKKLVQIAAKGAQKAGAEVTYIDLRDYPLPIFDEDLETREGMPKKAQELKDLFLSHQGLLIASPEYNSSVSGALKNMIDWVSRRRPEEPMFFAFQNKVAVIMSTAAGGLGGMRGLVHLRSILTNINVLVLPEQKVIPSAHNAFNDEGILQNSADQEFVENLGVKLTITLQKLLH